MVTFFVTPLGFLATVRLPTAEPSSLSRCWWRLDGSPLRTRALPLGRPLGTDFLEFYAASFLALHSSSVIAYDWVAHHATEIALIGPSVNRSDWNAFTYPPVFLLVCLPFASSYLPSLIVWLGS